MQLKRVVVTGMGALTPIGNNLESYWKGLVEGKSGAAKKVENWVWQPL
jgi:3-oxoacyl-[acyl-carrier-protein] synthase II